MYIFIYLFKEFVLISKQILGLPIIPQLSNLQDHQILQLRQRI